MKRFLKLSVFAVLLLVMHIQHAYSLDATETLTETLERQVISAYIFKFGNYVIWPDKTFEDANSPMVIGVFDDEGVAKELERISAGHTSGNRPVHIQRINAKNLSTDVHILYLPKDVTSNLAAYRKAHPLAAVLFITNTTDGLSQGGIINFVRDNNKLRFDVSLIAAEENKIKLDASLLTVTRQIIK